MIKLSINSIVLQQLQQAFPTPPNSAERQLAKYVSTLQRLLNQAILRKGGYQIAKKWFSISLDQLTHEGGRIGKPQIWMHTWLRENGFALVEPFVLGDSVTGVVSKVCLTNMVEVNDSIESFLTGSETLDDLYEKVETMSGEDFLATYLPKLQQDDEDGVDLDAMYHPLPVDIASLSRFIPWLLDGASGFKKPQKRLMLTQALIIKKTASLLDGNFYQRKKISPFGRTYYEGVSIQNIHKTLRKAVLGHCWEYDINSSVMAYKMGYAAIFYALLPPKKQATSLEEKFKCTISLIKDKSATREKIRQEVFGDDFSLSVEKQLAAVKRAITAIGFGAKVRLHGWNYGEDSVQQPALSEIFENIHSRRRFVNSDFVKSLMVEQRLLDKVIYSETLKTHPNLLSNSDFLNAQGKPIRNKILSFAYQTGETMVMDEFRRLATEWNHKVVANIHDAVFLENRLSQSRKRYIEDCIRMDFCNPYWSFDEVEIDGFQPDWETVLANEKAAIRWEGEALAKFLLGEHSTQD